MAPPRRLPLIILGTKRYYFDGRLFQLRNVDFPHDVFDLTYDEAEAIRFRIEIEKMFRFGLET